MRTINEQVAQAVKECQSVGTVIEEKFAQHQREAMRQKEREEQKLSELKSQVRNMELTMNAMRGFVITQHPFIAHYMHLGLPPTLSPVCSNSRVLRQ